MNFGPIEVLKSNAESKRESARSFRADAEKLSKRALEADAEAEIWERAASLLERASTESGD